MFVAATYLSGGSELLLEILGPGVVGGLFLPMLGALPDAMLILGTSSVFSLDLLCFDFNNSGNLNLVEKVGFCE